MDILFLGNFSQALAVACPRVTQQQQQQLGTLQTSLPGLQNT